MCVWSLGQEDSPEEGMATHSSIFGWEIPWTEKPGGLQSTGSQRVRHDWSRKEAGHRRMHVSVTVFLKEVSIWISGPIKADELPQCGQSPSDPFRASIEQKGRGRLDLHLAQLFELDHQSSVTLGSPSSQDFRLKLEAVPLALWLSSLQNTPHAFLVIHHADGRSWDCSASIQYFAISHIYLLLVLPFFFFFRRLLSNTASVLRCTGKRRHYEDGCKARRKVDTS